MTTRAVITLYGRFLPHVKTTICKAASQAQGVLGGVSAPNTGVLALCGQIRLISDDKGTHQGQYKQSGDGSTAPPVTSDHDVDARIDENIKNFKSGDFKNVKNPEDLKHFRSALPGAKSTTHRGALRQEGLEQLADGSYLLPHPIWSEEEVHDVKVTHKPPRKLVDRLAYFSVRMLRGGFDIISGYNRLERDEKVWLNRICFLETVAGVPGMVAAMVRHLDSLRKMRRDHGWIHTLLEEAENERMHLMTALQLKQPTMMFRTMVMGAQGVFVSFFSVAYLFSPRYCHRFVGYLEEEAVVTYSKCLKDIESGGLQHWNTQPAPELAVRYWNLADDATMRDVILAIRADEAHHRLVNHTLASMKKDDFNPYKPGE